MAKMRAEMLYISTASVVHALDNAFATLAMAVRAVNDSSHFVCGITDAVCTERTGFNLNPCGHSVCARHIYSDANGFQMCPLCGAIVSKMTEHRSLSISAPSVSAFFGRAEWADPPAALMRQLLDVTSPELHRGLFIGFLSVIQARLTFPIASFAPETIGALEYRSARECDVSPLTGFAAFFVAWRHQLCDIARLDRAAQQIAQIALDYGLFATWGRNRPHLSVRGIGDFLVSLPDREISNECLNDIYERAVTAAGE
jgi:hypothetical protein